MVLAVAVKKKKKIALENISEIGNDSPVHQQLCLSAARSTQLTDFFLQMDRDSFL